MILILEDDDERGLPMKEAIQVALPGIEVVMTDDVDEAIRIITDERIEAASLDHDVGHARLSGTDVAIAMMQVKPTFPVFVHSSNSSAGRGMVEIMANAGWTATYVGRNGETQDAWLASWASAVSRSLKD